MDGVTFEFVCSNCVVTRGVLDSDALLLLCPECGAYKPWKGPFTSASIGRERAEQLIDSPFYRAAVQSL